MMSAVWFVSRKRSYARRFPILILAAVPLTALAQQDGTQSKSIERHVQIVAGPGSPAVAGFGAVEAAPIAGHTVQFLSAGYRAMGETVKGAPYSADSINETVQTLADGNRIRHSNTATIYRDSEGRTRHEQKFDAIGPWATSGDTPQVVFINDPVANVHYILHPNERTATKIAVTQKANVESGANAAADVRGGTHVEVKEFRWIGKGDGGPHPAPGFAPAAGATFTRALPAPAGFAGPDVFIQREASENIRTEQLGNRMIEGVEAAGTRTVMTIPANSIGNELPIEVVSESWYSPELKTVVSSTRKDPRFGETSFRLRNVRLGEPLASLFEVPADYKVTEEPSVFLHEAGDGKGPDVMMRRRIPPGQAK